MCDQRSPPGLAGTSHTMRRRTRNLLGALVLAVVATGVSAATTLRDAAEGLVPMGAALNLGYLTSDATYNSTAAAQYSLLTAENECKWSATEPSQGVFTFDDCDALWHFAQANGMWFRGHNLCWGSYNPAWLEALTPDEKRDALVDHVATVAARYDANVLAWDVVNEAISDSATGADPALKNSTWYPDVPDFVDVAFQTAREACPTCKLFYNDYSIASSQGWSSDKSDAVYALVSDMLARGIPIDGVGFQLHIAVDYGLVDGVAANMARLAALGLEVHVTELDVACGSAPDHDCTWTDAIAEAQADLYGQLLEACLDQPACTNFETWGFTDKYSWLDAQDGSPQHPLPFDEDYVTKDAFDTMVGVLEAAQEAHRPAA